MSVLFKETVIATAWVSEALMQDTNAHNGLRDMLIQTAEEAIPARWKMRVVRVEPGPLEFHTDFITNIPLAVLRSRVWKRYSSVRRRYGDIDNGAAMP